MNRDHDGVSPGRRRGRGQIDIELLGLAAYRGKGHILELWPQRGCSRIVVLRMRACRRGDRHEGREQASPFQGGDRLRPKGSPGSPSRASRQTTLDRTSLPESPEEYRHGWTPHPMSALDFVNDLSVNETGVTADRGPIASRINDPTRHGDQSRSITRRFRPSKESGRMAGRACPCAGEEWRPTQRTAGSRSFTRPASVGCSILGSGRCRGRGSPHSVEYDGLRSDLLGCQTSGLPPITATVATAM